MTVLCGGYFYGTEAARPPWALMARFFLSFAPFGRFGVLEDTRRDGLQYSLWVPVDPQGFPVRMSFHFSVSHRTRLFPAAVFRGLPPPFFFRHFAVL